jgi:hypothetical protein
MTINFGKENLTDSQIIERIYSIRGEKVMIDNDLAEMYGVDTKVLNQAVKRNIQRFPDDFMFQLTKSEMGNSKVTICDLKKWAGQIPEIFT